MARSVEVTMRGPILEGRAGPVMKDMTDAIEREVADATLAEVQSNLRSSLRNPTGRYRRAVTTKRRVDSSLVTDGGVVYGPWLEGVGRRNAATRFKGYAAFRRAKQAAETKAGKIAEHVAERYVGRLR